MTQPTVRKAAQSVGVPESTVYRWLRRDDFKKEYNAKKMQMVAEASSYLQIKLVDATETILAIMQDKTAPSQSRLNAARSVYEYALKLAELRDVEDRVNELERLRREENGQ